MAILDRCIILNSVQIFLVALGVVDMCHLLVNAKFEIKILNGL